jgi:hypothetical protein
VSSEELVAEIDAPLEKLGTLTFDHGDNVIPDLECDRLALSGHMLMACSVVASPGQVKAVRAILHAKKGRVQIRSSGISVVEPSRRNETWAGRTNDPWIAPDQEDGYNLWVDKLEYGKVHATFISKSRKLLMYVSPEAVWARLMDSEHFETPLIREWMPYVTKKLVEKNYLRECKCFRANAATLEITKISQLDDIVTSGLETGAIKIPKGASLAQIAEEKK